MIVAPDCKKLSDATIGFLCKKKKSESFKTLGLFLLALIEKTKFQLNL